MEVLAWSTRAVFVSCLEVVGRSSFVVWTMYGSTLLNVGVADEWCTVELGIVVAVGTGKMADEERLEFTVENN